MATPPPEATPVLKEDKPQLPPSPNGTAVEIDQKGVQAPMAVATAPSPKHDSDPVTDPVKSSVNGNGVDQPPLTNGATASPPKSPIPAETAKPSDALAKSEGDNGAGGEKAPTVVRPSVAPDAAVKEANNHQQDSANATPKPNPPSAAPVQNDSKSTQATEPSAKTEIPLPSSAAHTSSVPTKAATLSLQQSVDHEMKDVSDIPVSPTKVSRERETDGGDEPAAKRTKIESDGVEPSDFKVPKLPSPAAETSRDHAMGAHEGVTKMQHKFLVKSVQSLKRMHESRFYREPVDPIKMNIPHYPSIITEPMDLGTIERKLKRNEYASVQLVIDDLHKMVRNALVFNGPDHMVTKEGQKLKETFNKQLVNLPRPDEVEEKKIKKSAPKTQASRREPRAVPTPAPSRPTAVSPQATTFALGPEGLPLIRRDSTNADGRPKRSIHPPKRDLPYSTKPKKKKYQWELRFCQEVLDELHKPKHYSYAAPFYYPVDPVALNIPTYHSIIKKPMDLSTIQSKLKTGQYENSREFEVDVRLIFKNCFKFNIPGDPTYVAGQTCQDVFDSKWAQKARYLEAHEPHPEHHSADSSESESEEDVEDSDDDEKLTLLQKQIAEMSRQVEAITQKKKKTPPSSKKLGKSKSGKKEGSKKSGAVGFSKKDRKGSKSSKSEKRWVSYHEKQIISNGISSLPDKKMQEALRIIQNNVPSLKGTQETEIELDIDELPNEVLLMLLKFVKKNAPHVVDDEDMGAPLASAPSKPKKNKPMSKFEQEAQINMLESNLSRFQGGGSGRSPDPMPSVEANFESSDEEDDTEESEEE
ncbi:hypothetical protein ASPZODRAFT_145179 [Penicilliopsis zonata CBS 506.65]|uniref:Bromo domain-containing protein n=1 Tax=Penicilliopsis zonata CBS 506.65 TaxID=1073090 RepID=A0A1L9SA42_9EURO|nr:hypothetical protein ASPZODRAFT_145179 [Penicilliopsis zonata CBS 506.65]OJJ44053.1 hypothetical protein ASPZODRAFT_145179 [Penicilliopsis zonata CBS 506.65]